MNQEIIDKFVEIESDIRLTVSPYSENSYLQIDKFFMTDFDYPTLNIVDKIKLTDFEMYCIDAITEEKIVYPSEDYTLLSVKDKILVVFHNYRTFTPKTYLYAEYNGLKSLIQVSVFEDIRRFFHSGKDHSWGSFLFAGSKIINKTDFPENSLRCDINDYGPKYWTNDGGTNNIEESSFKDKKVNLNEVEEFSMLVSVPRQGHIIYLRLKPIDGVLLSDDFNNDAVVPAVTRTIFELMKLISEWASVSEEPFNNTQDISTKAKGFIDGLGIPEPIKDSIDSLQTDMQVYRYLAGSENARQRPPLEEVALMPQSVYDWFKQQFCYRSFSNLILYHPVFNDKT
jgi:hypothetical protein